MDDDTVAALRAIGKGMEKLMEGLQILNERLKFVEGKVLTSDELDPPPPKPSLRIVKGPDGD